MAIETFEARGINSVVWHGSAYFRNFRANGSDIKPASLVTQVGETYPDIDLCGYKSSNNEYCLGVVLENYADDIDTAYDDNEENVPVAEIGANQGLGVYVAFKESPGAIVNGVPFTYEDITGQAELFAWAVSTSGTFATSAACIIGKTAEAAADNATGKLRKVYLGL